MLLPVASTEEREEAAREVAEVRKRDGWERVARLVATDGREATGGGSDTTKGRSEREKETSRFLV